MPTLAPELAESARATLEEVRRKEAVLANLEPYLIDLSLRENAFGSPLGQTLADKIRIFPRLREFGFANILLGTLDYARPTELEVDDLFMMKLRDTHADVTGCFAFTDIGLVDASGAFTPSASMGKMRDYQVPNTLHEIYLSREGCASMPPGYTVERVMRSLAPTVRWLNDHVTGDHGGKPRILVNIVDGCDAFAENPLQVLEVLQLLATLPIEGVSLEDDRGTFMPFQVGAYVSLARRALPPPLKLLVHVHSGAGFENASIIEALLNGADGAWGGLPKRAAIIGHASLGELIANLMRVGNTHVETTYRVQALWPLATELQLLADEERIPADLPIFGSNAYRVTLEFFRQISTRYMDLVPERIGAPAGYRVCPLGSDDPIVEGRLREVMQDPHAPLDAAVIKKMVQLMRSDLLAGHRHAYDTPAELLELHARAQASQRAL